MKINTFVYEECISNNVPVPNLPVLAPSVYGQCGEDLIVASLLKAFSIKTGKDLKEMTFLEIGANCPISTSATYLLANELEMSGVLVEANPALVDNIRRVRKESKVLHFAVTKEACDEAILYLGEANEISSLWESFVDTWPAEKGGGVANSVKVPAITLPQILETYFSENTLDFLSLDIEGMDFMILKTMDFNKYRPFVIQIEPSEHFNIGETQNILKYLEKNGYYLIAKTDVNCIFLDIKCGLYI